MFKECCEHNRGIYNTESANGRRETVESFTKIIDYTARRGDTLALKSLRVRTQSGIAMLGADGYVSLELFSEDRTAIYSAVFGKDAQDERGYIAMGIFPADTARLIAGRYRYTVRIVLDEYSKYTVAEGVITMTDGEQRGRCGC